MIKRSKEVFFLGGIIADADLPDEMSRVALFVHSNGRGAAGGLGGAQVFSEGVAARAALV